MSSKHANMPHYRTQVGMMAPPLSLPAPLPGESPFELLVLIPAPAPDPEPEPIDTLPFIADTEEDEDEPTPAPPPVVAEVTVQDPVSQSMTPKPTSGIDSYTTANMYHIMAYLPSDLRQFSFFGGGRWVGRHRKDDSQTRLLAVETVSETIDPEVPKPESSEEPLTKKRKKEQVHVYPEEHYGKIWRPSDPGDDPEGGVSMA